MPCFPAAMNIAASPTHLRSLCYSHTDYYYYYISCKLLNPSWYSHQPEESLLAELDLLVQIKHIERKVKKVEKEKSYNANKISKFIYFFFTLQNKGIPVNEIYQKDGVKFIKTDRF